MLKACHVTQSLNQHKLTVLRVGAINSFLPIPPSAQPIARLSGPGDQPDTSRGPKAIATSFRRPTTQIGCGGAVKVIRYSTSPTRRRRKGCARYLSVDTAVSWCKKISAVCANALADSHVRSIAPSFLLETVSTSNGCGKRPFLAKAYIF
jgi:hypothetical protein